VYSLRQQGILRFIVADFRPLGENRQQIFKKAIVLALILFGLFLIYRLTSSIVNRYFNLNALKNISISAIIMFPLFLIIILPVTYLLNQNKTHTK